MVSMQLNYSIQNDRIYDKYGIELPVDENGYVNLFIAGKECRFVKPLFIAWVNRNPHVKTIKPKQARVVSVSYKPRKQQKERKKETKPRIRTGIKITAIKDGKEYGPFISLSSCAKVIGITKATISKIINGDISVSKWSFKKV